MQPKKGSLSKNDLDSFLLNLKSTNKIQTQHPNKSNLIQQSQVNKPYTGNKITQPIEILEEKSISKSLSSNQDIFQSIVVIFPLSSLNLTGQRIDMLINLIKKNKGLAFNLVNPTDNVWVNNFSSALVEEKAFILVAKDQKEQVKQILQEIIQILAEKLTKIGIDISIVKPYVVSCEWVSDCIAKRGIMDYHSYCENIFFFLYLLNIEIFPEVVIQNNFKEVEIKQTTNEQIKYQKNEEIKRFDKPKQFEEIEKVESPITQPRQFSPLPDPFNEKEFPEIKNEEEQIDSLKKKRKQVRRQMIEYRELLDYNYDTLFENYHQSYEGDDYDDEKLFDILKEEKQEYKRELDDQNMFKGDDECFITDVKGNLKQCAGSLFEGITLPEKILDVEAPLLTSEIRDISAFNNPGFRRKEQYWEQRQDRFACESGVANRDFNSHIIEPLNKLLQCYQNDRDKGRTIAYNRAIAFIKSLKFQIKSEEDVYNMPTIGTKIKKKIVEILQTGKLKKAEFLSSQTKNVCIQMFTQIWGVGPQTAVMFYLKGMRSFEDLRKNSHLLNKNQTIGFKYVHELKKRIPRDECTQIINIVKAQIEEISEPKGVFEAIACGSYRRGKQDCGDLDILVTRRDGKTTKDFLIHLVQNLQKFGLLTDHLTLPSDNNIIHQSDTYMGICQLRPDLPHRRLDIKLYPSEQFGYAVLYFTGSDHFNRSMRLLAQKKGYSLSDHGLYPALRAHRNQKVWQGELIPCYTEEDVFKILKISYKKPEERSL